jgi:SAM-dependent methyltransferase
MGNEVSASFSCRLCDGSDLSLYFRQGNDGRFRYYKCRRCGLVNLDLSEGLDQSQYTEDVEDPEDDSGRQNRQIDQSFRFLQRQLSGPQRLCDIGTGNGRLLLLAKRAGWDAMGVELSESLAETTSRRLGVEIIGGNFLEWTPRTEHCQAFDLVSLRHVLEHLPDSRLALQKIRALLRPGGHALFEMPNIEGWDKRIKRSLVNAGWHKRTYAQDFIAGHCNEFSRRSFEYLLDATGFRLVRWETYSNKPLGNWLLNLAPIGNKARALVQVADRSERRS